MGVRAGLPGRGPSRHHRHVEKILKPTYGGTVWDFLGQRACSPTKESAHDDGKALDWMMSIRVDQ